MTEPTATPFSDAHAAWHGEVERARTAPFGPLSATAMHWLSAEPSRLPDLPGVWSVDASGLVSVELAAAEGVTRDGAAASGRITVGPLTGLQGDGLTWGDVHLEVAARSGGVIVRPRDPAAPTRSAYTGTDTFPTDERWVIEARFTPRPRANVEVASAAGADRTQHYDSAGVAEFEIDGTPVALTLFGSPDDGDLRAIFADETGHDLTFPAARFVTAESIDAETVRIDFNRASNPPCAYSDSATCPFPPPENRLPVRIEAGELRPGVAFAESP